MNRTTESWEALLEGTTEGPWTGVVEYHTENEGGDFSIDARIIANYEGGEDLLMFAQDSMVWQKDGNIHLAAAAPEAVAEVVRLRRELEELRDALIQETSEPHYEGDYGDGHYSGLNQATSSITRILNGDTK